MNRLIKSVCLCAALGIAVPAAHAADTQGTTGQLISLKINETSSDSYAVQRGSLVIHENGLVPREYRFGGTICSGRNLSEQNQNNLASVDSSPTIVVTPFYKSGQGNVRCLVGYRLQDRFVYIE
ncbi:MAG: hypothetical protein ACT4PZ_06425 [Panacagrimonas sp.]